MNMNVQWKPFPNLLALDNLKWINVPLKSINQQMVTFIASVKTSIWLQFLRQTNAPLFAVLPLGHVPEPKIY